MLHSGYDGGDCCECTCVSTDAFTCGDIDLGGFSCVDPSAPCAKDDDLKPSIDEPEGTMSPSPCRDDVSGDGDCNAANNNAECGGLRY